MKQIITFLTFIILSVQLFGQNAILYHYDAAGNRISRISTGENLAQQSGESGGNALTLEEYAIVTNTTFSENRMQSRTALKTPAILSEDEGKTVNEEEYLVPDDRHVCLTMKDGGHENE